MIKGCWIATHIIEVYSNVGNPQLFSPHAQEWRFFAQQGASCMGVILCGIHFMLSTCLNTFDQIKYFIVYTLGAGLWIFYVFVLSCVCYVFVRVCLYVLCGHLLGKG